MGTGFRNRVAKGIEGRGRVGEAKPIADGALEEELAAALAALGAEFNDPVGEADTIEIVFDQDDGVAGVAESEENLKEPFGIDPVETGGGFVEDVKISTVLPFAEFEGQLQSLGLTPAELGGRLAEAQVSETDGVEGIEDAMDAGILSEKSGSLLDRHFENLGNVLSAVADLEGFPVVAGTAATGTRDGGVGEEFHLEGEDAIPAAVFAAAAGDIEAETAGTVTADLRERGGGKGGPESVEELRKGGRVGAGTAPDRFLIDENERFEGIETVDPVVEAGNGLGAVELAAGSLGEDVVDEGALAGTRDAADHIEATEGETSINSPEVMFAGIADGEKATFGMRGGGGVFDPSLSGEERPGKAPWVAAGLIDGSDEEDLAAMFTGTGSQFDQVVSGGHGGSIMFNHDDRAAAVAEAGEGPVQAVNIAGMEADTGFIENVGYPGETGSGLSGESDPLSLSAAEGVERAVEAEIVEPDLDEETEAGLQPADGITPGGERWIHEGVERAGESKGIADRG